MNKKVYIIPALKSLDIRDEQLLFSISVDGGTTGSDVLTGGGDGDAGTDGLGKGSSVWDD